MNDVCACTPPKGEFVATCSTNFPPTPGETPPGTSILRSCFCWNVALVVVADDADADGPPSGFSPSTRAGSLVVVTTLGTTVAITSSSPAPSKPAALSSSLSSSSPSLSPSPPPEECYSEPSSSSEPSHCNHACPSCRVLLERGVEQGVDRGDGSADLSRIGAIHSRRPGQTSLTSSHPYHARSSSVGEPELSGVSEPAWGSAPPVSTSC